MGIASLLLGAKNPFAQWVGENQHTLDAIGTGIGSGQNIQSGLSNALQLSQGARQLDRAAMEKQKAEKLAETQISLTNNWMKSNYPQWAHLPPEQGFQLAMQAEKEKISGGGAAQNPYMSAGDGKFFNWQTGEYTSDPNAPPDGGGDFETGFTPVWGTYEGKPATVLPGNDGQFYINGKPIDPSEFVPTNPYDLNAQKAGGRAFGTATGGTQFSVPSAQLELNQSVDAIGNLQDKDIKAGMEDWFKQWGALPRGMWVNGGSNLAKFQNAANNIIDRSWLSARAMLKGAGQVTDYEGTKAENAVSMMKTALEKGDKASYEAAVKDYEYWINQGFAKIQQQAGAMDGYGGGQQQPPQGSWTVLGVE